MVGWKTDRKIVVFSVDDYGNVRLDSKQAREELESAGLSIKNRFDTFDALETTDDLDALYQVLTSVKDKNGHHAVFTPFALPCNINFEGIAETGYQQYIPELLPFTFQKQANRYPKDYRGAWELWKEGIQQGIFIPQFHGREHVNLKFFNDGLINKDYELLAALKNRSYTGFSSGNYKTISPMAAFDFWDFEENGNFDKVIKEGLNAFEEVFGFRALNFNPPAGREHPVIHNMLKKSGIQFIDTPILKKEHQGNGKYKRVFNYTGKTNNLGQIYLVRNVVFEPTDKRGVDWTSYTLAQIDAAFRWNKPAIVSSHRVNFCGHIDPENRKEGLNVLQQLLDNIVEIWPDVEFMAADELGNLIKSELSVAASV